jgi:hypothetical protein
VFDANTFVGAVGASTGTPVAGIDSSDGPIELVATTTTEYSVPFVNPEMSQVVPEDEHVTTSLPADAVTT